MKHPDVKDLGLRNGVDGVGSPSDYHALSPAEAVERATTHVIRAQLAIIERLTQENRELRRELGRP
jgi:hypothetical protein